MPDYLSQVQEEEEALGVQYELEESQHHTGYPDGATNSSSAAAPPASSSSSSSVHLPVISQVSSSTQNCENFSGFRSPEPLDPLDVQASPQVDVEEAKVDNGVGRSSLDEEQRRRRRSRELASITIQ